VIQLQRLPELARKLAFAFNAIVLMQLVLIATANPSWTLMTAVLCECGFFLAINLYRARHAKPSSSKAEVAALEHIEQRFRVVYFWRRFLALSMVSVLTLTCLYMSADLSALALCRCGQVAAGERLYEVVSLPVPGLDPAFSLELLTGAFIERGHFQSAEPLELALLRMRRRLFGEKHEMTAAMYSNLADFYGKWGRPLEAENYYRRAIKLTKLLNLKQGWGSPSTKLGTILRNEGRLSEAEASYLDALSIRTKIFGANSARVSETLAVYEQLLTKEKRTAEAAKMQRRADAINESLLAPPGNRYDWLPAGILLAIASLLMWQRGKILVYCSKLLERRAQPRVEIL
jgi:tetratricopeptide (TPR) repeat protein